MHFAAARAGYIKVQPLHPSHIPSVIMEHRASSILWIVLFSLLGSAFTFQEKSPQAQPHLKQPQQVLSGSGSGSGNVEDSVGTTRNIDEQQLTSIGKAGFGKFFGSSSKTTAKPTVQHQHNYYYTSEDSQHPRQNGPQGYPWGGYHTHPPPQRPWVPPYSQWPYGYPYGYPGIPGVPGTPGIPGTPGVPGNPSVPGVPGYPGPPASGYPGYPGYHGYPGYPGVPRYPNYPVYPGYPSYPGYPIYPGYPGYPGYPWYRNSENEEPEESQAQQEVVQRSVPASYQARVLAATSKSNSNVLPLYQLLNLARV
ncbi:PREDICTED: collagen alpha-2(IV) chain [Drosophila arizonae]|uniref:Collagen alpha-2(IV) chain n=1 Tax=Drosophila arizonae TaxID=7263 RepID=A0ABM1P0A2_DROAR|nr:PREDICTED: collagen alpha-2(IV) chain [Drosophila arizonae]